MDYSTVAMVARAIWVLWVLGAAIYVTAGAIVRFVQRRRTDD